MLYNLILNLVPSHIPAYFPSCTVMVPVPLPRRFSAAASQAPLTIKTEVESEPVPRSRGIAEVWQEPHPSILFSFQFIF